ncbi:MAG: GHKL domain-containing protein [Lachnospiraceae bacterium]|nr:GHKL domain-containing protein [Lachnospiraceae bacterium]
MYDAAMQFLYMVENILCMRGILQVEFTEKKGRLAAAGLFFAGMLAFQGMIGFGENAVPVFLGVRILLTLLMFSGKAGVNILRFFFCLFYMSVLTDPVETMFFVAERHFVFHWKGTAGLVLYDLSFIGILTVMAWVIGRHEIWKERIKSIPVRYYAIGLALSFCAGVITYFVKTTETEMPVPMKNFIDILCMLLAEVIYLVWVFLVVLDHHRSRYQRESQLKSRYLEMAKDHYRSLESHVAEVRRIRHDMRHHLTAIGTYLKQGRIGEAEAYLEKEGIRLDKLTALPFDTGNQLVSAVIAYEKGRMAPDMSLYCEGKLPKDMEVQDYDLCCIFANLLSNAREACERLKKKEKEIFLRLRQEDGRMALLVENPLEWEIDTERLISHTTKENVSEHGYGLLNVKETVESYRGELEISVADEIFRVMIII